jgi:hypothetical protein
MANFIILSSSVEGRLSHIKILDGDCTLLDLRLDSYFSDLSLF